MAHLSNILVSADGTAKLLDFGVAKLLDGSLVPGDTPVTRADVRMMTPEYSSPEQFAGEPTTTAADVYSLGVILYELLSGRRPFERAESLLSALEHSVLHEEPQPPSVACRAAAPRGAGADRARARATTVDTLSRRLRGDLDTIALTALQREPDRRYESVAALRADIERHRAGLPISARPAALAYRAAKFTRRHRVALAAASLLVAAVGAGATTTWLQARAAAREGRRAQQIRDFLVGVFEISSPDRSRGEAVTARELLDRGSERISRELSADPVLQADMHGVVGTLYRQLGLFEQAADHLQQALTLRRTSRAPTSALVTSLTELASARSELGASDEAEELVREALVLARAEEGRGPLVASVLTDLAAVHRAKGEYEAGEPIAREAVEMRREAGESAGLADTLNGLGVLLDEAGRSEVALPALDEALRLGREAYGETHTKVALTECNLAVARHRAGQLDAAAAAFETCIAHRRRLLGDRHADVGLSLNNLGLVHSDRNEYETAERLYLEAVDIQRAAFGERHRAVAGTLNNLAVLAYQRGRFDEAADRFREIVAVWREVVGPDHPNTLTTTNNLGMSLRSAGRLAEAERVLTEVLEGRRRALGPDSPQAAESLLNLASVLQRQSRFTRARTLVGQALPILERAYPEGHPLVAVGLVALGRAQLGEGRGGEALASFDRAIALRSSIFGAGHLQTAEARVGRGRALAKLGRAAEGRAEIELALAHLKAGNHLGSLTARDATEALAALGR